VQTKHQLMAAVVSGRWTELTCTDNSPVQLYLQWKNVHVFSTLALMNKENIHSVVMINYNLFTSKNHSIWFRFHFQWWL